MNVIKMCVFIIAALFVSACSKQTGINENDTSKNGLAGAWEWIRTDGGIGYHIHDTPLSTGKQVVLKIAADSTYAIYTNDTLTLQGTYTLETKTCIHDRKRKAFINFSSGQGMMIEKADRENLELSDEAFDGLASRYKRIANTIK